jgi:NAD(P)-dependent dehydrogenase (short-subunit alcohol dehydrogenase family)
MKTFLSIGSGPGMGLATAERFAKEDYQIVVMRFHPADGRRFCPGAQPRVSFRLASGRQAFVHWLMGCLRALKEEG